MGTKTFRISDGNLVVDVGTSAQTTSAHGAPTLLSGGDRQQLGPAETQPPVLIQPEVLGE